MKKGDSITMTAAEQRRLMILNQVAAGALLNAEGASLLGLSVRQLQRVRAAYRQTGAAALSHGNRGRPPVNALEPSLGARVVQLATTTYLGFNQHHLTKDARRARRADPVPAQRPPDPQGRGDRQSTPTATRSSPSPA